MEIKVRCFPCCIRVISRILNRCKIMNIHIQWNNNDSSWMLSSRSFYAFTTFGQIYTLRLIKRLALHFLLISLYITICRFFLYRTYSTRSKYVIISKYLFCVGMRIRLIFTRKVQIDIGNFISFKT